MTERAIHHRRHRCTSAAARVPVLPRRGLAALLGVAVLAAPPWRAARAQDETWTVRGIGVDVAGDAVAGRERALADGTRQAWEQLLGRIVPPERAAALRTLPLPEIEALLQGVEINDEAVAPNRYRATLTITFDAGRVRTRLAGPTGGSGGGGPIEAHASFSGVRQWAELRRRLGASVAIAAVELKALRAADADLTLLLTAAPANAAETLAAEGIRLEADQAGGPWRVRLAGP